MKRDAARALSIASVSLSLLIPNLAQTQRSQSLQPSQNVSVPALGENVAMRMVPAQATLADDLDAVKSQPGQQFRAKLSRTVRLEDGSELPHGTVLVGVIATDETQVSGRSKLALRFTQATLKDGKVVPIKATIVGVLPPSLGYNPTYGDPGENHWNSKELQVDKSNALPGVDLHSNVAGSNSGVFITNKKDDVKLSVGTQIELAITAALASGPAGANGMSTTN
jgi:hypothetical protein